MDGNAQHRKEKTKLKKRVKINVTDASEEHTLLNDFMRLHVYICCGCTECIAIVWRIIYFIWFGMYTANCCCYRRRSSCTINNACVCNVYVLYAWYFSRKAGFWLAYNFECSLAMVSLFLFVSSGVSVFVQFLLRARQIFLAIF